MHGQRTPSIRELVGRELDQITFVRDYVQFGFDGYWLTLYHWPKLIAHGETTPVTSKGYCGALRELIGTIVRDASLETGRTVEICLSNGATLSSSLEEGVYTGPEVGNLSTRVIGDPLIVF